MDLWAAIAEERQSLIDTLEVLTAEQWATPSLCSEWTVRDVLGHLVVAADPPKARVVIETLKARGNFDKANSLLARAQAERPTQELLATYRGLLTKRFNPPGLGAESTLTDILMHSLDIRIPLGLAAERPAERYAVAADLNLTHRVVRILMPRGRPALRWVATDHGWTQGSGDEVQGTMADLALTASGRGARLEALTGPGQPRLVAWLHR